VNDDNWTWTKIHALSGIRTHGFRFQAIKTYDSDSAVSGTDLNPFSYVNEIMKERSLLTPLKPREPKRERERVRERERDSIIFVRSFPGYARSSF
jgi:hypothetical protein